METTAEARSRLNVLSFFLFQARIGVLCQSCVALLTHPRLLAHLLDVSVQIDHSRIHGIGLGLAWNGGSRRVISLKRDFAI